LAPATGSQRPILYRDAAITDARSGGLEIGVSLLVDGGRVAWIRPRDSEEDLSGLVDLEVVDASGATIVPAMVDCHSHLTLPGGAHWIERDSDPPEVLLRVAEDNARLQLGSGVRWARDVGAPLGVDPEDGRERALSLGMRDRWAGRRDRPYVRAAGTWVMKTGTLPGGRSAEADTPDQLLELSMRQLDDGADFIKLYLDGPDPVIPPWTAADVRRVVEAAHARGFRVTAHAGRFAGTRVCADAGVDCIEHGFETNAETAAVMAREGVAMVTTMTVLRSWASFASTTRLERFSSPEGRRLVLERTEVARESVRLAHRAGVVLAAGTDFGGGSARANQMAWEVEALVECGLEPWEALAAATWRGGEVLGEPAAGVIQQGGPPDFFLVHGDPLSDPSALWRVWKVA
jgi:imidazolonepropionase-like amidohydrolase